MIARWTTPDPLAEVNKRSSIYSYTPNNPIERIDPDGMLDEGAQKQLEQWQTESYIANGFMPGLNVSGPNQSNSSVSNSGIGNSGADQGKDGPKGALNEYSMIAHYESLLANSGWEYNISKADFDAFIKTMKNHPKKMVLE